MSSRQNRWRTHRVFTRPRSKAVIRSSRLSNADASKANFRSRCHGAARMPTNPASAREAVWQRMCKGFDRAFAPVTLRTDRRSGAWLSSSLHSRCFFISASCEKKGKLLPTNSRCAFWESRQMPASMTKCAIVKPSTAPTKKLIAGRGMIVAARSLFPGCGQSAHPSDQRSTSQHRCYGKHPHESRFAGYRKPRRCHAHKQHILASMCDGITQEHPINVVARIHRNEKIECRSKKATAFFIGDELFMN